MQYPLTDLELSRQLEQTEALANIAFVEARARLEPGAGARHVTVAGVRAMLDGCDSPLTQTFGLGVLGVPGPAEFEELESFFLSRSAAVHHEVSPLAPPEVLQRLTERSYVPVELSTVLVRPTSDPVSRDGTVAVRLVPAGEAGVWSRIAGEGWSSESADLATFVEAFGRVVAEADGVHCFLAELEGRPVAAGALSIGSGVALLAGASTIPSARRRGAQRALLAARLEHAACLGIDLAMMVAHPGSASQRNAERQGFRTAYTRTKWRLMTGGA